MQKLERIIQHLLRHLSLYFFVFLIIFTFDRHHRYEHGKEGIGTFYSDVFEYYRFLPDLFINGGPEAEQAIKQSKRTVGMAMLYAPAFFIGNAIAKYNGDKTDGYSLPYQQSARWGSIVFCLLGLWFLRKSLLLFFNEVVVTISLVALLFGTNLFYYTYSWGELPHVYLFGLSGVFIYSTLQWLQQNRMGYLLLAAFMAGMITLIRPTGIMVLLFPLLFAANTWSDFKQRLTFIFAKPISLLLAFALFMLPLLLQMGFWKIHVGQLVYYSYGKERFFFNDPQIINFLFSYRKGWLLYTPLMAFSLAGMILCRRYLKAFFLFNMVFFAVVVYVLSSWWEWSYGGSFGCRALVEYYAFFVFPLAAFVAWFWDNAIKQIVVKWLARLLPLVVFYLCIQLNLIQTWQCKFGIMHWSGMSKEAYWEMFLKTDLSKEEVLRIQSKCIMPDANKMMRGDRDL